MKKIIYICAMLLMMSSCMQYPEIYMLLSDEDAAAIPYQKGQKVSFVNQNGDTLVYQVTFDDIYQYDIDHFYNYGSKMQPRDDFYCYVRTVIMECAENGTKLGFTIRSLQKELTFYFGDETVLSGSLLIQEPCNVNGVDYENVHHEILYNQYTGELIYDWYYNEEFGLLQIKYYDKSLTRIP